MPIGTAPLQQQEHVLSSPIGAVDASDSRLAPGIIGMLGAESAGGRVPNELRATRYRGMVLAKLLTGRMLGVHAAAVSGMALCAVLGRWQWARAAVTHSAQNGFYAFEWWSFAVIMFVVWIRTMQDEVRPAPHPDAPPRAGQPSAASPSVAREFVGCGPCFHCPFGSLKL